MLCSKRTIFNQLIRSYCETKSQKMDEFTVRSAPSSSSKKFNVFKLHKDDTVSWAEAKMRRDNDYQPWQIKFGNGRNARRFKAIKEGGVGDNASFFVFYKPNEKSDTYEICPVDEWYSVSATQRYKTLTSEEAEEKFEQRNKMLNLFSVMRKTGENGDEAGSSGHDSKAFKVSELDDWDNSGDDENSGNEDDDMDESKKKARRKKAMKKEEPDDAPDEAKEDSDEGDFEQREVDYMSDSSSESSAGSEDRKDENDVKGIAEEEALRDLLSTDDDEDEDGNVQKKNAKTSDIKSALTTADVKKDPDDGSEDSSDSDDYDVDEEKMDSMFNKKGLPAQLPVIKQEVRPDSDAGGSKQQASGNKRKVPEVTLPTPPQPVKRPCPVGPSPSTSQNGQEKTVEDLIIKYLSRRPMTLKTLLKDIKSKLRRMEGVTHDMDNDLVNTIAAIIKRLQPDKQKINDVTYLSLKS